MLTQFTRGVRIDNARGPRGGARWLQQAVGGNRVPKRHVSTPDRLLPSSVTWYRSAPQIPHFLSLF